VPRARLATGLRPEEWAALERRDLDRRTGILSVRRTVSDGVVVELAKTNASRRQVPLSRRASAALDLRPPRLDTPLVFPALEGGLLDLYNFRRREWGIAVKASGDGAHSVIASRLDAFEAQLEQGTQDASADV